MDELDLIYEASCKFEYLTDDKTPIRSVVLKKRTFDAVIFKLEERTWNIDALNRHRVNNYFIYKGITFCKEE